jgi:hypothetical protein
MYKLLKTFSINSNSNSNINPNIMLEEENEEIEIEEIEIEKEEKKEYTISEQENLIIHLLVYNKIIDWFNNENDNEFD